MDPMRLVDMEQGGDWDDLDRLFADMLADREMRYAFERSYARTGWRIGKGRR